MSGKSMATARLATPNGSGSPRTVSFLCVVTLFWPLGAVALISRCLIAGLQRQVCLREGLYMLDAILYLMFPNGMDLCKISFV